jgi:hypothetical protein
VHSSAPGFPVLGWTIEQELEGDGEVLESATKGKGTDPQPDVADLSDCC